MKKIIVFLFFLICIYFNYLKKDIVMIPNDAIRFRIVANSDLLEDQTLKLKIKKEIDKKLMPLFENVDNKEEADKIIKNNLSKLNDILNNYTDDYYINYGSNFFPQKEYNGVIYQSGNYDSLVITLGSGNGKNFWCVLYPPLCLIDENNYEYHSLVKDIINHEYN